MLKNFGSSFSVEAQPRLTFTHHESLSATVLSKQPDSTYILKSR